MFDRKFLITLVGLVLSVFAICNYSGKVYSRENYAGGLPQRAWKVVREIAANPQAAAKGDFYTVPGTYQSILEPRFGNVDYGANLRYNMPSSENQGVPCEPLTFGKMAKENFSENYGCSSCGGGCTSSCTKGGEQPYTGGAPITPGNYAGGNYTEVLKAAYNSEDSLPVASSMLPVQDMTAVNALGETVQPITYDRFIYANRNSRLRGQGDPIRGDLPIVPCAESWFRPSAIPNIDLQQGAMNVIGGTDASTANSMAELIMTTSGDTTIGGVNMANQFNTTASAGIRDIQVMAMP